MYLVYQELMEQEPDGICPDCGEETLHGISIYSGIYEHCDKDCDVICETCGNKNCDLSC